ncbi:spore cortex biosynthesis protein YabQ [Effusibacillus pohliae]|uniref:spore cortex biosynthesis protein YabQ n=1 Tax=Effusibacillus pohliae TaxID=232270 RepID=UPI000374BCDE|nr:spore cortex biosynthesis protein YabQ [Effusibacillus pohliae]
MTLEAQYMTLLVMSINGAVLGAVHDMYRVVLRHWRFLRWAGPIFDFAFWIVAIFLVFSSLMWANDGELRMYVFVVMMIGYVLYRIFLQRLVVGSTVGIILAIRYFCLTIYRGFLVVVIGPLAWAWRLLQSLLRTLDRLLQMLERLILWPFQPLGKMLLWLGGIAWKLAKRLIRPFVPYLQPYVKRAGRLLQPIAWLIRAFLAGEKGIWARLANWLLNRDGDKPPKP